MNLKFEKITNIERILEAAAKNSSYEKQVQSLLEPHNFERLVTHVVVVGNLANLFPDHSQELFELLIKPQNFQRLVTSNTMLNDLATIFPDCEILQKDTISEVLKEIKCNTSEQKAYTRGAAVGFFDQILPQEHSAQIGSLLDRASGARLAQTTKKAADTARNEHDKLHKPK